MIVGYILVSALAGLIVSVVAFILGASVWLSIGLYALVGSATLVLAPIARLLVVKFVNRGKTSQTGEGERPQIYGPKLEPVSGQLVAGTERPLRILAVDDDPFILELIPMISAKEGFSNVTVAASGKDALGLLHGSDTVFDCFLLDISMEGMDGIELCRRVRQIPRYSQTPVIMLTALRDIKNIGDAYRAGATDYTTKPFDIEDLAGRLRIAQDTIEAQRKTDSDVQGGTGQHFHPAPYHGTELPNVYDFKDMGGLVSPAALSSYLTQLPRKAVAGVRVYAISIDGFAPVSSLSSPKQFGALLENLATATVETFGADQTVMAYTDTAILLVAASSVTPLPAINIEINIERWLQGNGSGEDGRIGISVGGPVQLQGTKAERARMAMDRVIALSQTRALSKQSRPVAGLSAR